ncbi:MAG TPA: sugar phosphate isomerase/epimerase family protein [Planctomycetaceae bacterium]|nr:sugar phosphate isomerase/epimerase family protein [Planctomycetaceae bacterium]
MIRSAVTISLVNEARGGPFVYWDDLAGSMCKAAALGYHAVEIFAPAPDAVSPDVLKPLLAETKLNVAAVGTGAGWVKQKLSLTSPDETIRQRAIAFIQSMIDFGGPYGAPAIIGSMQGRHGDGVTPQQARDWLRAALDVLGEYARKYNVPLIYEPLNRYETNLINTMAAGVKLMMSLRTHNVRLLADLFHMNIEETDIATGLRTGGKHIGHVHFVDSNRRPVGHGHMPYGPIIAALRQIQYDGYLSAEAFPWPNSDAAAEQTMRAYQYWLRAESD